MLMEKRESVHGKARKCSWKSKKVLIEKRESARGKAGKCSWKSRKVLMEKRENACGKVLMEKREGVQEKQETFSSTQFSNAPTF